MAEFSGLDTLHGWKTEGITQLALKNLLIYATEATLRLLGYRKGTYLVEMVQVSGETPAPTAAASERTS